MKLPQEPFDLIRWSFAIAVAIILIAYAIRAAATGQGL